MSDQYQYEDDLDDTVDTVDFGKYNGTTPADIFSENPGYIIWAHENTNRWVGSEELIRRAYGKLKKKYKERQVKIDPVLTQDELDKLIEEFEEDMLECFGQFPKPAYSWSKYDARNY